MRLYLTEILPTKKRISISRDVRCMGDVIVQLREWGAPESAIGKCRQFQDGELFNVEHLASKYHCEIAVKES